MVEGSRRAMDGVVGFVVAGGRSRRMRQDKALLPWGPATLLDHAIERLQRVSDEVRILCGPEPRYGDRGVPTVTDAVEDEGALGGVFSGLLDLDRPLGLFLAVDLPAVPVPLLEALLASAAGWDAVVPRSPGGPEPLCAVYSRACVDPIRRRLRTGGAKMTSFWPDVRVREISPGDLARFGDPASLFANVNAESDYARLKP